MKYPAWIGQAVSALSNDGKSRKEGKRRRSNRHEGEKKNGVPLEMEVAPASPPKLRIADEFSSETWRSKLDVSVVTEGKEPAPKELPQIPKIMGNFDEWTTSRSTSSDTLPTRADSSGSTTTLSTIHKPSRDPHYSSPTIQTSSSSTPRPQFRRSRSSSSIIFTHSPSAPITIIVTTPDEEPPSPTYPTTSTPTSYSCIQTRATRSYSTPSLHNTRAHLTPNFSTTSLPTAQDTSRLMPPSEHALDVHRLRKAQEFREVRKFIISFLNAKGDTFPKTLRTRIMDGYAIDEKDLDPETVARFRSEPASDEGVALDGLGAGKEEDREISNAENLRILELAFRSQIPTVTPKLEKSYVESIPSRFNRPTAENHKSRLAREEREQASILLLGTTLSTSDLTLSQFQEGHRLLKSSSSVPNMQRRRPSSSSPSLTSPSDLERESRKRLESVRERTARQRTGSVASRSRSTSVSSGPREWGLIPIEKQLAIAGQQTRIKRQNIISGAFGAVREAMGGGRNGKEVERRRMMIEGR